MAQHRCMTCGNSYKGWECPVCSKEDQAKEQPRQGAGQQEKSLDAAERIATRQKEQTTDREENLQEPTEAVEEASFGAQVVAVEPAEKPGHVTANVGKPQSPSSIPHPPDEDLQPAEIAENIDDESVEILKEAYAKVVKYIEEIEANDDMWAAMDTVKRQLDKIEAHGSTNIKSVEKAEKYPIVLAVLRTSKKRLSDGIKNRKIVTSGLDGLKSFLKRRAEGEDIGDIESSLREESGSESWMKETAKGLAEGEDIDDIESSPRQESGNESWMKETAKGMAEVSDILKDLHREGEIPGDGNVVQTPPPNPPQRIAKAPTAQSQGIKPADAARRPPPGIRPPQFQTATESPSRVKYVVFGLVLAAIIAAGIGYFTLSGPSGTAATECNKSVAKRYRARWARGQGRGASGGDGYHAKGAED